MGKENGKLDNRVSPAQLQPRMTEKTSTGNIIFQRLQESSFMELVQCTSGPSVAEDLSHEDQVALLADKFRRVKKYQRKMDADLEQCTNAIAALNASWKEGKCDLGEDAYGKERQRMLSAQQKLLTAVTVLRTAGAQLAGRWTDDLVMGARQTMDDRAYIDAGIRSYAGTEKAEQTPQRERKFRSDLVRCYASAHPSKDEGTFWCPVAHEYLPREHVTAVHVIKCNIGEKTAQAIFGDDTEHIWSAKNGLFVEKAHRKLLDEAKAVILPASDNVDETDFVFYLLTKDLGRRKAAVWGNDLHGRALSFKNEFRPSRDYLYFKCVLSILHRRRTEDPGFELDFPNLPSPAKILWAAPGPCLRQLLLYKISRTIGCMTVEDANRFWRVQSPQAVSGVEDVVATLGTLSCSSLATNVERSSEEEDTDDCMSSGSDGGASIHGWDTDDEQ